MPKFIVPIKGMHCKSCEILVEQNLNKVCGVVKADVDHKIGQAVVYFENTKPAQEQIASAVEESGYKIGIKEKNGWLSKDVSDYQNLLYGAVILFVFYFIARSFGIFNVNVNTENSGLGVVLLVGLVAGISTCMAMVGGLVLGLSARHAELHPEASAQQKFRPHIYFNLGRVIGFALLGGIIGLLGSAFKISAGFLGVLTIIVSLVMIFLGLKLINIFPFLQDKNIVLPKSIAKFFGLGKENREYSHRGAIISGAATFFLPCGFTQAMQLYAVSSGSFTQGALIMGLFALGTAPGLLGIGGLSSIFKGKKARIFFAAAGIAIIIFGWYNISNASRLFGNGSVDVATTAVTSDAQVINMVQGFDGYSPNVFTIQKGRQVKWVIKSETSFSCASYIVMPKFNISQPLKKGENIITFMPTETGEIPFSCSMGMYTGKFIVVDKVTFLPAVQKVSAAPIANINSVKSDAKIQLIKSSYAQIEDVSPNEFTVKKGQPVKWVIAMNEPPTGCMHNIVIREIGVSQPMNQSGDTIVEFTPTETGDLWVTCSMGIHRATIHVV
ncbi:MAG: sulfite exporter TauE/SafE family protein [Candidatus Magasanikbacteria bacterium]|jgi:sulfite exporter TauE/SafE/copper chaperone CopZ